MNHQFDLKTLPKQTNPDGVEMPLRGMEAAFKAGFARVTYAGRDLYANKEGKTLTRAQKSALVDLAISAGKDRVFWDNGQRLITLWERPDAESNPSTHLYDPRGGAAYSPDAPETAPSEMTPIGVNKKVVDNSGNPDSIGSMMTKMFSPDEVQFKPAPAPKVFVRAGLD